MAKDEKARLDALQLWTDQGWSVQRLRCQCKSLWGLNERQADALLAKCRQKAVESLATIERPEFLAQQMTRLEALAVKAQEEGNLAVALGCIKELNALAKLHVS